MKPRNYHGFAYDKGLRKDKRAKRWAKQRAKLGFDETETWGLYASITSYTLPRLRYLREAGGGCPGSFKNRAEWDAVLDQMIRAFAIIDETEGWPGTEQETVDTGLNLFAKWFLALWW